MLVADTIAGLHTVTDFKSGAGRELWRVCILIEAFDAIMATGCCRVVPCFRNSILDIVPSGLARRAEIWSVSSMCRSPGR